MNLEYVFVQPNINLDQSIFDNIKAKANFSWNVQSLSDQEIDIKINFQNPLQISQFIGVQDIMAVTFNN